MIILVTWNDILLAYCNNVMQSTIIDSRGYVADIIAFSSADLVQKAKHWIKVQDVILFQLALKQARIVSVGPILVL